MKYGFDFYCSGEICVDLIQKCDYDIRKDLYNNIVLSGGNFMFSRLKETIEEDAKTLVYESMKKKLKLLLLLKENLLLGLVVLYFFLV